MKVKKAETKKRAYDDDDSEDESAKASRKSGRRSIKSSRYNSPEPEEDRSSRRNSKKLVEPPSSSDRRASKRSLDPFKAINLSTLVDEIIKHKHGKLFHAEVELSTSILLHTFIAWPFLKPVSISEVPDYYDVIKRPMDFGKIKSKLNLGEYRTNEQVLKDIEQIFSNCDLYNVTASEIHE